VNFVMSYILFIALACYKCDINYDFLPLNLFIINSCEPSSLLVKGMSSWEARNMDEKTPIERCRNCLGDPSSTILPDSNTRMRS